MNAGEKMLNREQQSESLLVTCLFLTHFYFLEFMSTKYSKIVASLEI